MNREIQENISISYDDEIFSEDEVRAIKDRMLKKKNTWLKMGKPDIKEEDIIEEEEEDIQTEEERIQEVLTKIYNEIVLPVNLKLAIYGSENQQTLETAAAENYILFSIYTAACEAIGNSYNGQLRGDALYAWNHLFKIVEAMQKHKVLRLEEANFIPLSEEAIKGMIKTARTVYE